MSPKSYWGLSADLPLPVHRDSLSNSPTTLPCADASGGIDLPKCNASVEENDWERLPEAARAGIIAGVTVVGVLMICAVGSCVAWCMRSRRSMPR